MNRCAAIAAWPGRMSGRKSACYNGIMTALPLLDTLSDDQLIAETKRLVAHEREATAALLRALMELDARRLYLREGCASLFTYCTQVLHLAEGAAYNRIEAARAARRYPTVLAELADGSLTLTSIRLLAPHFTEDNHRELLAAARHKSKRERRAADCDAPPEAAGADSDSEAARPARVGAEVRAALEGGPAPLLAARKDHRPTRPGTSRDAGGCWSNVGRATVRAAVLGCAAGNRDQPAVRRSLQAPGDDLSRDPRQAAPGAGSPSAYASKR